MTNFVRENFSYHGGYVTYLVGSLSSGERKFVARFKYASTSSAKPFMTFLIKNFTVEEYFGRLEKESPLPIVESKGFILSHIKKWVNSSRIEEREAGLKYIARVHERMKEAAAA